MPTPPITLLGPQRNPRVDQVLAAQGLYGARIALINAGWREREPDDALFSSSAGGNIVNLHLWHLMQQVWDADPEFEVADRRRRSALEESQELYLIGLDHVVAAIRTIVGREPRTPGLHQQAIADAEEVLRHLDRLHEGRIREIYHTFWREWPPHERPAVATARAVVARHLQGVEAVMIAGGHVGVLIGALHLFNIAPQLDMPVIAWGAGAMALTDKVVLFHDSAAQGPAVPEVFSAGIGLVHGIIALPSARERLDVTNPLRMGILARRFAPDHCLLLDERAQVEITPAGGLPEGAAILGEDGSLTTYTPPDEDAKDTGDAVDEPRGDQ